MGKPHPSLFYVLEALQKETREIRDDIERLRAGHSPVKKRKKYDDLDKRIFRVVEDYETYKEDGNRLEYLRLLGHTVAGNF